MNNIHNFLRTRRTPFGASLLAILITLFTWGSANAQVITNGGSGLAVTYPSLDAAITALNALPAVTAPIVITLNANETAPIGGYVITATGTPNVPINNSILIQGLGAPSPVITANGALVAGTLTDAIFKIVGGDFIKIQNLTMQENPANTITVAATNNMTEWGVALLYATTTNGAQNDTIQNNTISLNRTYQNTFGVYANATHSATAVATTVSATTTTGGNSGLGITANTISNVNNGIVVVGPLVAADQNNGVLISNNTITNYGTTGTFSTYANVSGTIYGILVRNSINFNINTNTVTSSVGGVILGTLRGIFVPTFSFSPVGTITNNVNANIVSLQPGAIGIGMTGIEVAGSSANATTTLNVGSNNFTSFGHTIAGANAGVTFINVAALALNTNILNNTFTNITLNTTASVTFITNNITRPANAVANVNNNRIVTAFSKTGAGGIVTFYVSNGTTPPSGTETNTGNNFSNVTVTGATGINGWTSTDGSGVTPFGPTKTVTNNTFSNITAGTSNVSILNVGFSNAAALVPSTISGNIISNISCASSITGLTSFAGVQTFTNNTITGFASTGAAAITGMNIGGGTIQNITKNKIGDLSVNNAGGSVFGLTISNGFAANLANNLIGDLRAPLATGTADAVRGINITSIITLSNINIFFNTVNIGGTSSGANFSSSAIFHTTSATATTATLDMRNNIFVNNGVATGTGNCVAYRRSSAVLTNFALTSNRNDFFAPVIFADGTNTDATLAAYQARVTTADANSLSVNPAFLSTAVANPLFLRINSSSPTTLESAGANIVGITDDVDGDVRQGNPGYAGGGTAPDMGADEFNLVVVACSVASGGTSATSTPSICANGTAALSNTGATTTGTGLSYQWQVSTTLGGPYANVVGGAGATTFNYTSAALTAGTYYYVLRTTCVNGPVSGNSNEVTVVVNPTPTITVTPTSGTYCSPGGTAVVLTASGGTTYTWSPAAGLSATTGASISASPTATTTYTVTGTTGGCPSTATVTITVNAGVAVTPATATNATICSGGTSQLNTSVITSSANVIITEVTVFRTGTGQTTTYPAFVAGGDLVEISNVSSAPVDISGFTLADYANNNATATHGGFAFPTGTIIPVGAVAVVHLGAGTDDIANRYYNTGGSNELWSSSSQMGIILKNGTTIVDAVGLGGSATGSYTFEPTLGVTAANWSGFAPNVGGFAGVIKTAYADNNSGADWSASSATLLQTIGTYVATYAPFAPTVTYSWSPTTFLSNPNIANPIATGVTATTPYTVTATVGTCSTTSTVTVTVAVANITVTPVTSSSTFTVGTAISNITLVSTGGTAPYTYAVTSGTLPSNLTLVAGVISGIPTTAQLATPLTITSTDNNGCTGTVIYTFTVNTVATCPAVVTFSPTTLPNATVGVLYNSGAITATNLTGTVVYSSTTLPTVGGFAINSVTGAITGTPATATAITGIIVVATTTTPLACTGSSAPYTIIVNTVATCPAVVTFSPTTLPNATVGVLYNSGAITTNLTGTVVYSSTTLPTVGGFAINSATGAITGTPATATAITGIIVVATTTTPLACTGSSAPYTITVTAASTCPTNSPLPTLTLTPAVASANTLVRGTVGVAFSQQFTAAPAGTYTYAISTPASVLLANGLTFSATGLLSGTPSLSTSVTFRVTATNGLGCSNAPVTYSLVINPNPATAIDNSLVNSVKVSPNPSNGDFNVDFGSINMAKSSVRVYDAQGKVVFTSENNSNLMVISLENFANGIYLMEVETSKGRLLKRLSKTN